MQARISPSWAQARSTTATAASTPSRRRRLKKPMRTRTARAVEASAAKTRRHPDPDPVKVKTPDVVVDRPIQDLYRWHRGQPRPGGDGYEAMPPGKVLLPSHNRRWSLQTSRACPLLYLMARQALQRSRGRSASPTRPSDRRRGLSAVFLDRGRVMRLFGVTVPAMLPDEPLLRERLQDFIVMRCAWVCRKVKHLKPAFASA